MAQQAVVIWTPASGVLVDGRYRLEERVAEGGMASVWRAQHVALDSPVAVKFLHPNHRDPDLQTQQFLREARVAAAVRHRNVVDILDFGTESGVPFMVMEFLSGETLSNRMVRAPTLNYADFIEIVGHALNGLSAVHMAGIIHRDLKPENIFIVAEADGAFPKILDFGISKATDGAGLKPAHSTHEGRLAGTPHYMSPEQARGLKDIDHRADIYAMGAVLYEGLTGKPPYDSENPGDLLIEIVKGEARTVEWLRPELGSALSDVVAKAMAREPEQRYSNALEMRDALIEAAARTEGLPATTEGVASVSLRPVVSREPVVSATATTRPPRSTPTAPLLDLEEETLSPEPRRRGRRFPFAISIVVAASVGAAIAFLAGRHVVPSDSSASGLAHAPRAVLPVAPGATTIHLSLRQLPERATVWIDGARTVGPEFDLPRDPTRLYDIEVRPPRGAPWRVYHRGGSGAVYDVTLDLGSPNTARVSRSARSGEGRPPDESGEVASHDEETPLAEESEAEASPQVWRELEERPSSNESVEESVPPPSGPTVWRDFNPRAP